jgi:hypothetical protein
VNFGRALIEQAVLLTGGVEPGVIQEVLGTAQTGAVGEEKGIEETR